jgi:hypothetical protein
MNKRYLPVSIDTLNCQDIENLVKRGNRTNIVNAESPEALIAAELANELSEMGWLAEDFRIMPRCKVTGQ